MTHRTRPFCTALLALSLAAPMVAQGGLAEAHRAADSNKDGVLDRLEFQKRMMDVFYFQDANRDGRLSKSELPGVEAASFARSDTNGDSVLQLAEFLNARASDFSRADTNADGSLTAEEANRYE